MRVAASDISAQDTSTDIAMEVTNYMTMNVQGKGSLYQKNDDGGFPGSGHRLRVTRQCIKWADGSAEWSKGLCPRSLGMA